MKLKQIVIRALLNCQTDFIEVSDLPPRVVRNQAVVSNSDDFAFQLDTNRAEIYKNYIPEEYTGEYFIFGFTF